MIFSLGLYFQRFSLAAAELNGALYVTGGYDGIDYLMLVSVILLTLEYLELSYALAFNFTSPAQVLCCRRNVSSTISERSLRDGWSLSQHLFSYRQLNILYHYRTAERFDPREHSWTKIPSMNTRRGCHSMIVLNEKL